MAEAFQPHELAPEPIGRRTRTAPHAIEAEPLPINKKELPAESTAPERVTKVGAPGALPVVPAVAFCRVGVTVVPVATAATAGTTLLITAISMAFVEVIPDKIKVNVA